jgi:hypothetical protein
MYGMGQVNDDTHVFAPSLECKNVYIKSLAKSNDESLVNFSAIRYLIKRTMTGWPSMLIRFFQLTLTALVKPKEATPQ